MKVQKTRRKRQKEAGIALLIAIFILLLIGVAAIALVVSSGTESALAGNYRSSTSVYYAAVAGLEEARSRLRSNNPNSFSNLPPGSFLPPPGTPLAVCNPVYVLNPAPGEVVTPWDSTNAYYDQQYGQEFGGVCGTTAPPSTSPNTTSVWQNSPLSSLPFPGPPYKWVRISAVTEQSLKLDTCPNDTSIDATLVFYGVLSPLCPPPNPYPIPGLNDRAAGAQVLEVTALAVLPNGSEKLVQYLVAPIALPPFSATLTMAGQTANSVAFSAPQSNANYRINGGDQDAVGSCVPGPPVDAIGVFNGVDEGNVINGGNGGTGIPAADRPNYTGSNAAPDVNVIASIPPTLQTPAQLEALVQGIIQVADVVIPGPATGASLPSSMYSPNPNPMTVVVNGDLDLNGWKHTGYGLLLVRGHLNYDPDASWDGIVMVVGQGIVTGTKGGTGVFDGALLIAKTLDAGGNLLSPNFGLATMLYGTNMGGRGMRYSSCWIQASQPGIRILSFHEISQ